ncbi:MAG: hypothetical protein JZU65_21700 [Chlorobium sp.]|nr:hypothetical protein [Chlorobium sp.]
MKLYAVDKAKIQAYNKTKDFQEGTVACVTCNKTIPMNGVHYVAFGFYQCHNCGERGWGTGFDDARNLPTLYG